MDKQNQARIGFTINLFVDQIGAVFFITLIYVIVKNRKLRDQHCLKFIGIFMFCNLLAHLIDWLPYLIRVIPLKNMPMFVCCGWHLIMSTPCAGQLPFSTIIAFDRTISVFFPIWYCQSQKRLYFLLLCTLGFVYPAYCAAYLIRIAASRPFVTTNCTRGEILGYYHSIDFQFIYASIICYALILVRLLIDSQGRKTYFNKQPLFKSITLLLVVEIGGRLLTKYSYQYIPTIFFNNASDNQLPLIYYAINCFSSLAVTGEFFAIYLLSSEHRKALKKEFPRLYYYFPDRLFEKKAAVKQNAINIVRNQINPMACHAQMAATY